MDDIPNKIQNYLGILCNVNLHESSAKYYIEIDVKPYDVPISYHGKYHYRSGSTKQELKGTVLNEFLLKKAGKTWDDVIEPNATYTDIDEKAIKVFKLGELPEKITIEDLKRKHASYPINPRLADVFFKGGLIEAWGRGTLKIINECIQYGLPEPAIELMSGGIAVTI